MSLIWGWVDSLLKELEDHFFKSLKCLDGSLPDTIRSTQQLLCSLSGAMLTEGDSCLRGTYLEWL